MNKLIVVLALVPCSALQAQLNSGGAIAGSLSGDDGTKITGGYVSLSLKPPYPARSRLRKAWASVSDVNGIFRFYGLSSGTYEICTQVPKSVWLSSCSWGVPAQTVSISAAQPSGSVAIVLRKGAVVTVRVDDTAQLLASNEGKSAGADFLVGVGHDTLVFEPALVQSTDASGRTQQVVIPYNYSANLLVFSSFFKLADATGAPLPTNARIPITVSRGQPSPVIKLSVTGGGKP